MYVRDNDTGKFWLIAFDAYGQRYAQPLDESEDPDWNEFDPVQAAIGPLAAVAHVHLQALYDKRGKPQLPPAVLSTDHDHDLTNLPSRTGGVIK